MTIAQFIQLLVERSRLMMQVEAGKGRSRLRLPQPSPTKTSDPIWRSRYSLGDS
ncbi:MAG: hypothetical protein AB4042_08650 [Leptolyngbyaceae cyanobacterium]